MTRPVHVVALGARTPVGYSAAASAAAVRAGVSRVALHPRFVDATGEQLRSARDAGLDADLQGDKRLLGLASFALDEALTQVPERALLGPLPARLLLAVPEHRPGFQAVNEASLLAGIARVLHVPIAATVAARGHAGALHALGVAAELIESGRSDVCVVGGIESYLDADTVDWLTTNEQIGAVDGSSAFIPGEAAAFVVLMSTAERRRSQLPSLGVVRAWSSAYEASLIRTDAINLAKGLTSAIQHAGSFLRLPDDAVDDIWCDLNGERYRTDEWSYALQRSFRVFRHRHGEPVSYQTGCDSWGDVGAATGALLAALSTCAWSRDYASGRRSLLFAGSEAGLRSAVVLEKGEDV